MSRKSIAFLLILAGVAVVFWPKGELPPLPTRPVDPDDLIQVASEGERFELADELREGRWTIVEFYADW